MREVEKQSGESWALAFEFKGKLPTGLSLSSGTVSAVRTDTGATDNTVLASTSLTISGTQAIVRVQGGASGITYEITALVTLSDTVTVFEENLKLIVLDR